LHFGDRQQFGQRALEALNQLSSFGRGQRGDLGVG
jgi:hypothetical protein